MELITTNRKNETQAYQPASNNARPWVNDLAKYSPAVIVKLLKCDPVKVLNRPTPTLANLYAKYGINAPVEWLDAVLRYTINALGVEANDLLLLATANGIYRTCYGWRIGEVLLFFAQFITGKYGKFYGRYDNAVIYEGMQKFWRGEVLPVRNQQEREEQERKREEWAREAITPDEFARRNNLPEGLSVAEIVTIMNQRTNTP